MPGPKNINQYSDARAAFDSIVEAGGGRLIMSSPKEAHKYRARLHTFRRMAQELAQEALEVPGRAASTPYDKYVLSIDGSAIVFGEREIPGTILGPDGEPVGPATNNADDDLLRQVQDLGSTLGLETGDES